MGAGILSFVVLVTARISSAQNTFRATVRDHETKEPVAGATVSVKGTGISAVTGPDGAARLGGVPEGAQTIEIFSVGYETRELKFTFPLAAPAEHLIYIEVNTELGEVTVTTTRTGREIDDVPTRVEAIGEEEVGEEMNMRPANV